MERIDLNDLIANSGLDLEVITTTTGRNGYPENLITAVIGFESFDEAEKFAKENKLELIQVQRKFGSNLWNRMGAAYKELERDGSEFGDDWMAYSPLSFDAQKFFTDNVKDVVTDMETLDDAIGCLNKFKELVDAIENADDDELVLSDGSNIETITIHSMHYSCDSTDYAIVAIHS